MPQSVSRLWDFMVQSSGQLSPGELILRVALICCSMFAAVQLLSMLATHYGDRNAMSKSLFLSVLLHCCFGLGWATVLESYPRIPEPPGEPEESDVRVTFSSDEAHSKEEGNTRAMWDLTPSSANTQTTRMQRSDEEQQSLEDPERESAPPETPLPTIADLPTRMEEPSVVPVPQSVAATIASPAQPAVEIDQAVADARPEVSAAAMRQQSVREASTIDISSRVEPQRGAAERSAPTIDNGTTMKLPAELNSDSPFPKAVGIPDESIRRRTSPGASPGDIPEVGADPASTRTAITGNSASSRFTRSGNRPGAETNAEPAPPSSPSTPRQPMVNDRTIASRSPIGSEAIQTPRPELSRMEAGPLSSKPKATRDPETYRSRRLEQRRSIALKNGGSEESERAVEASLHWMASIQERDGHWSAAKYGGGTAKKDPQNNDRRQGGMYADTGITGLVILSFLGAGYTHEEGKYTVVVQRALDWLIAQQAQNGMLVGQATYYDQMYCHAIATFALAEAYGMQHDPNAFPELRDAVRSAVKLICDRQNTDGGWRYAAGTESDMSMFGWQLMALKSGLNAGISVPEETRRGMKKFLQSRVRGKEGGLAGYKATDQASPAMTAEALFCWQMFGTQQRGSATQEAVNYLRNNLPKLSAYDEYYWYYGTLAMYQQNGEPWDEWNGALRDTLVGLQRTSGPVAGSWDPKGKWAGIGGRLYSTAVSTMCLEVYYRYLRIYRTGDE